jgi:glucosyl-dolichyl phosphate glucuronosyltransferase
MRLDLLIPTLRRPQLLNQALQSVGRAEPPRKMHVRVIVVNNDARPDLPGVELSLASMRFPSLVLHEPQPGKSSALNRGIAESTADYIGFIDDDEELAPDWFRVVENALEAAPLDFLGGRALPAPGSGVFPAWVPAGHWAVLGMADSGPEELTYGSDFPGMLMGGNAVIARAMLDRVGPYRVELGPRIDRRLFSCEDEDMYLRMVDAGAHGRYLPQLLVYHSVHADRLHKRYYRAWTFWNGAAKGVLARRHRRQFHQIAGVPRYVYGDAMRGMIAWARSTLTGGPANVRMAAELPVWHLAGRLYGAHMRCRVPATNSTIVDCEPRPSIRSVTS